jgi:hypothetical protein
MTTIEGLNLEPFFARQGDQSWNEYVAARDQADRQNYALVRAADPSTRLRYLYELVEAAQQHRHVSWSLHELAVSICDKPIDFQHDDIIWLMQSYDRPFRFKLHKILALAQQCEQTPSLLQAVRDLVDRLETGDLFRTRAFFKLKLMVYDDILANCHDPWVVLARQDLRSVPAKEAQLWQELLYHCSRANAITPSRTWITSAQKLLNQIGSEQARKHLSDWLAACIDWSDEPEQGRKRVDPAYRRMQKGLFWLAGVVADPQMIPSLLKLTQDFYKALPRKITRKYTQALLWSIAQMPEPHNYQAIGFLQLGCSQHQINKHVSKIFKQLAEVNQLTMAQVQERAVGHYANFSAVGVYEQRVEDFTIRVSIRNNRFVLAYFSPYGEALKRLPNQVKVSQGFKEFQRLQKLVQRDFKEQLWRIEQLYRNPTEWGFEEWRQRYLDHPLVGAIARRLIWRFQRPDETYIDAIWHTDRLVKHSGEVLEGTADLQVQLWHPLGVPMDDVLAWRTWIKRHKVKQPFPQAEREVYILTEAERNTETYSNRFAGHIFRKRDLQKACKKLRWQRVSLYNADGQISLLLPDVRFKASYWLDGVEVERRGNGGVFTSDQVRFYQLPEERKERRRIYYGEPKLQPMVLVDVPELLFSEVMRDIYSMLESCPTQIDPSWQSGGDVRRAPNRPTEAVSSTSWSNDLKRRTALEQLLPRLKIGSRCYLEGDYLVVEGKLGDYKISYKNGCIFMSPSQQYLCIVSARHELIPDQTASLLHVKQDHLLSTIISKAILLANDDQISDTSILRQIEYAQRNFNQQAG